MSKNNFDYIQKNVLIPILDDLYSKRGELADIARKLENIGMAHAKNRLSELRAGKRKLTYYYLQLLIAGGIMNVKQILNKRKLDDLTKEEKDLVLRWRLPASLVDLLYEAEKSGIDIEKLIKVTLKK